MTLTITGSFPFPAAMTATLSKTGQPDIVGTNVFWVDPVTVAATVGTVAAAPGLWDLEVTHAILGSATLPGAITVKTAPKIRRLTSWGGPVQAMEVRTEMIDGQPRDIGYVARGSGMVVLDVTDPANMVELGNIDLGAPVMDLAMKGNYALVGGRRPAFLSVVDVSDPANLQLVASGLNPCAQNQQVSRITIEGDVAYVIMDKTTNNSRSDACALDVSDPASLGPVNTADSLGAAFAAQGDYRYQVDQDANGPALLVRDLSIDPMNPPIVGTAPLFMVAIDHQVSAIAVEGDYAYITSYRGVNPRSSRLSVVDISNPATPFLTGLLDGEFEQATDITVSGGVAYVADFLLNDARGLVTVDVSTPTSPTVLGAFDPGTSTVHGLALLGSTAYALDHGQGIIALDVSDPANPAQIGLWRSPGFPVEMDTEGNHLFFNDFWRGMSVLDVSDPRRPTLAAFYDLGPATIYTSTGNGPVLIEDGVAYVAAALNGLQVLDVSDPTNPSAIGGYLTADVENMSEGMALRGDTLAVSVWTIATGTRDTFVFDVTTPSDPILASIIGRPQSLAGLGLAISDDSVLYGVDDGVCDGMIHDILDPYNVTAIFACGAFGRGTALAVDGNLLLGIFGSGGPKHFGILEIEADGNVGGSIDCCPLLDPAEQISIQDGLVFVTGGNQAFSGEWGLNVVDIDQRQFIAALGSAEIGTVHVQGPFVFAGDSPEHAPDDRRGTGVVSFLAAVPGDGDNDFDTDLADYAALQRCFGGDGVEPPEAICLVFDFDEDDDVDLDDHVGFMLAFDQASVFWASSDPAEFTAFATAQGLTQTGFEDFEELNIANGQSTPLNSGTPPLDEFSDIPGIISPGDIESGLSIESNILSGEAFEPNHELNANSALEIRGALFGGEPNTKLVVVGGAGDNNSYDLVFDAALDLRAVGLDMVQFGPLGPGETCTGQAVQVMVFDTDNLFIRRMIFQGVDEAGQFLGVWSSRPIGRINVWSGPEPCGLKEGADNIQMWSTP